MFAHDTFVATFGAWLREQRRAAQLKGGTMSTRPRALDLFSGEGGASVGYERAGFDVTAVDIDPQPRHRGGMFVQADAFAYLEEHGHRFDFVHASPMCRDWTVLTSVAGMSGTAWQLTRIRKLLVASGKPFVIENVMTAPLRRTGSVVLCADNLGLRTVRHRRFEPGGGVVLTQPPHRPHRARTATSRRRERWDQGWHVSITGDVGTYVGPEAMGIDWMSGDGLSQAIPPVYAEIIGRQVLEQLGGARVRA